MSGLRSLISPIARSSRPGTKYWPPQWRSERWAIVRVSGGAAPMSVQCKSLRDGAVRDGEYAGIRALATAFVQGVRRSGPAQVRERGRAGVREDPRLLRPPVGLRAADVRARTRPGRPRHERLHTRLLPPGAGSLRRGHGDAAVARDAQEPEAPRGAPALSRREGEALLPPRHRAARTAVPVEAGVLRLAP